MFLPPGHAELKPHPFANLIPPMKDVDRTALGESIAASGQINPIMLHRGMILDGRHRYAECARLGRGVRADNFDGDDRAALEYVLGANLARRHLDETERARVANNLARMRVGVNQHTIAAQRERAAATELPLPKGVIPGRPETPSVPAQAGKHMRPEGEAGAPIEPPVVMGFPACAGTPGAARHPGMTPDGDGDGGHARRVTWPAGHAITTTLDEPSAGEPDEAIEVGTCECGEVFRAPQSRHAEMEALCEAHWRTFDHVPERVDDRGRPLSPAELARLDPAQLYRQIADQPDATEPPVAIDMAPVSQAEAAALLNVSRRTVQNVAAVDAHGAPELQQALADGRVKASAAAEIAQLPIEEQRAIIAAADPKAVREVAKKNRAERRAKSREAKLDKMRTQAAPLVTGQRYGVIYVDIPRDWISWSAATGMEKAPENHYPTEKFDFLAALPIRDLAAESCALLMWAWQPSLIDQIELMAEWGFCSLRPRSAADGRIVRDGDGKCVPPMGEGDYRSHMVWGKRWPEGMWQRGTGFWWINAHELLLLGVRGDVPCPLEGTQNLSVLEAPAGEHSAKPDDVRRMIDRYFPGVPKIELFARMPAETDSEWPDWRFWGDGVGLQASPPSLPGLTGQSSSPGDDADVRPRFLREKDHRAEAAK